MKYWIEANTQFQIPKIILGKFFRSGFLGVIGGIRFLEYLDDAYAKLVVTIDGVSSGDIKFKKWVLVINVFGVSVYDFVRLSSIYSTIKHNRLAGK